MLHGFYRELGKRQIGAVANGHSASNVDFGFLEEIPVVDVNGNPFSVFGSVFTVTLLDFLHGACHIFSRRLYDEFGYAVENLFDTNGHLIHSFCIDGDGNFVDVRGKTADHKAFFADFEDEIDLDCLEEYPTHNKLAALADRRDRDMYRAAGYVVRDYYGFYVDAEANSSAAAGTA